MRLISCQLHFAVFDPSYRKEGSYWQWTNTEITSDWDRAIGITHHGWPAKTGSFEDMTSRCYGVLGGNSDVTWLYRAYPAGRDGFGRPGRYFIVLFRLSSTNKTTLLEVASILAYFENERSLPLKTAPLDHGLPSAEPDVILQKLFEHLGNGGHGAHWGMDEHGGVIEFAKILPTATIPLNAGVREQGVPQSKNTQHRNFILSLAVGLAAAVIIAGYGMHHFYGLGYDKGFENGSNERGYDKGRTEGYTQGYNDGVNIGRKRASNDNDPRDPAPMNEKNSRSRAKEMQSPSFK